jgi:hypothetical protein
MKFAILLAAAGIASAAVIARDDFQAAGDHLSAYLETTEPQHHDTALNARSDLNAAELTAREALDSLVESVSLVQRSPETYLSGLVDNKAKREAAPWCDSNRGAGCWKAKRDAEPWCDRNRGAGCWKAKRDASPGPWCNRNRGAGCWKHKRDVADSDAALLEQRACLAEGGLCQHTRRAAEAVLSGLNTVETRDSDLAVVARNVLDSLQANYE